MTGPIPIGLNTYCLRSLRWHDVEHLEYCAKQRLDAIFLQDSLDPKKDDPSHWQWVRGRAKELGLHLETGGGGFLPRTPGDKGASIANLRQNIRRAAAMGSPIMRVILASDRASFPPGPVEAHMETAIQLFREVKSQAVDANVKLAVEVHKDLQAWEHKIVIEEAGKDFVGTYLDTGNPVFVLEDPSQTLEVLGQYALTVHLRDSVVYEHRDGIAVQWVPLGEGTIDFPKFIARLREIVTGVHIYIKPITGRPPYVHKIYDKDFWTAFPKARSADFARFLTLAKKGHPYDGHVVIEDLYGRPVPGHFLSAVQYQQREHMERSIAYARKVLGLGVRS
ncbi:MAG: sugar phosphate isomerase/epimerase [Acidobacteria bacterium]|nr:sugar phosphate isomerase/epimerase [Acidobacteriota bacterium]